MSTNKIYLLIAFICMIFFSICEALNIERTLKLFGNKVKFRDAYKYALGGFFLSSITPSSSGGDPMQLYLMLKDKISVGHAAITLLVKLVVFQFVVVIVSLLGLFTSYDLFSSYLGNFKYLVYLGILLNVLVFTLYFLTIFCKPIIIFLVDLVFKILNKFHYKKANEFKEKMHLQVLEYEKAANLLKQNKLFFLKNILTTTFQMITYYSITYFVYLAFGLSDYSIFTFIAIQSVLFVSVSSLPFPGAVGISEATFMRLYKTIFTKKILASAMIITRFINFYIYLIYSLIILGIFLLHDNYKKKY